MAEPLRTLLLRNGGSMDRNYSFQTRDLIIARCLIAAGSKKEKEYATTILA